MLSLGRWLGVAPVTIHRRSTVALQLDRSFCAVAYVYGFGSIVLLLNILSLSVDLAVGEEEATRAEGGMTTVAWVAELFLVLSVTTIGAMRAGERMACLVAVVDKKEKIDGQVGRKCTESTLRRRKYQASIPVVLVTFFCTLALYDCILIYKSSVQRNAKRDVPPNLLIAAGPFMYIMFHVAFITVAVIQLEFITLACALLESMIAINQALRIEVRTVQTEATLNSIVGRQWSTDASVASIQNLTVLHCTICDLVRAVGTAYGPILLLILLSDILHLVISPYYVFIGLTRRGGALTAIKLSAQAFWLVGHSIMLIGLIEPCHRTICETKTTNELVNKMSRLVTDSQVSLRRQLTLCGRTLATCAAEYHPLGLCVLARPLLTSIISAVTTYLMILVQFRKINDNITPIVNNVTDSILVH